ncbi:MAG: helix-turn-helix domain-containing protein [Clostridia bacterium]|nr:helix-turn-helix domain-containing protein [Clostridia bacterium]
MKESIFEEIYDSTAVEFWVRCDNLSVNYATYGFTAPKISYDYGVGVDDKLKLTYYRAKVGKGDGQVVVEGDDETAKNYAIMLFSLLGTKENKAEPKREEKLRLLLCGELNAVQQGVISAQYADYEFNHFVLSLVCANADMQKGLVRFIETVCDKRDFTVKIDDETLMLYRHAFDDGAEYKSSYDFALVLYENIKEELRIDLTIIAGGTVRNYDDFITSYSRTVFAQKYGSIISPNKPVYAFRDYALIKLLEKIPPKELAKCLGEIGERNISTVLADEELITTARAFLENSLNISETSRSMFIHRNTLIYRLDKIMKETGLDLRNYLDASVFNLIYSINFLLPQK